MDQKRVEILNERRLRELIELEENSNKTLIKDDGLIGRQSGKYILL